MNGAEGLTGSRKARGTTLERALVREVRHYKETRLLEVTCGGCERQFHELAWARSVSDLSASGDLDRPDAV